MAQVFSCNFCEIFKNTFFNEYIHTTASIFYFSRIHNMFLSQMQQSYCYTQLCNYRKRFIFKPISNQLYYSSGLQFKFHWVLECFLPRKGLIIFSRLKIIKEFATSFPSLTLHAVNCCFKRKYFHSLFSKL